MMRAGSDGKNCSSEGELPVGAENASKSKSAEILGLVVCNTKGCTMFNRGYA